MFVLSKLLFQNLLAMGQGFVMTAKMVEIPSTGDMLARAEERTDEAIGFS